MADDRHERIRQRAHAIWEREGRRDGEHERHWHQATSEIDAEDAGAAPKPRRKAAAPRKPAAAPKSGAKPAKAAVAKAASAKAAAKPAAAAKPRARKTKAE